MKHFKALRVEQADTRAVLRHLAPKALPQDGGVSIRVQYSSLNYKDALAVTGQAPIVRHFPLIAGVDLVGEVVDPGMSSFHVGAWVLATGYGLGVTHDGGYAEYAQVPVDWVLPLPKGLSTRDAMALGTAGLTAALCLHRLEQNGQTPECGPVAVTGATGGVGASAVRALYRSGYEVVAITGKPELQDWLHSLGAHKVLLRHDIDSAGRQDLDSARWGGAIDNVGGELLGWLLSTARPQANIAVVGLVGGSRLMISIMPFILRAVSVLGISAANCPSDVRALLWRRLGEGLAGETPADLITDTVDLDTVHVAAEKMLRGQTWGRTLVRL